MASEEPQDPTVAGSVRNFLKDLATRDKSLAKGPLGASALALAKEIDANNSATSKAMCSKALNDTLAELRELAPDEKKDDGVDEIKAARERRRSGGTAATG